MNRFEALIRVVLWLVKKNWGLSFLLAFVSFWVVVGMGAQQPGGRVEALFEGPVFRAGVYVGTIVFPNYMIRGSNGFYLVPLFGAAADFLVLMVFWLMVIYVVRRHRTAKADGDVQLS